VKPQDPIVYVIDDDPSVRAALNRLLRSVDLRCALFSSPQEFLKTERPDVPACLVLDVRLPGLSGLELQRELAKAESQLPIIFITGHGDVPMSVSAMKAGAADFLIKPFRDQDLLDAIHQAIKGDRDSRRSARKSLNCGRDIKP
jgi:FixJ family two-component response regulator